jgi:hypothetical protein
VVTPTKKCSGQQVTASGFLTNTVWHRTKYGTVIGQVDTGGPITDVTGGLALIEKGGTRFKADVDANGRFAIRIPGGTYGLGGSVTTSGGDAYGQPSLACSIGSGTTLQVKADQTAYLNIPCAG